MVCNELIREFQSCIRFVGKKREETNIPRSLRDNAIIGPFVFGIEFVYGFYEVDKSIRTFMFSACGNGIYCPLVSNKVQC